MDKGKGKCVLCNIKPLLKFLWYLIFLGRPLLGKVEGLGRDLKYVHYVERMFFCLWNGWVQEVWNIDK